MEDNIEIRQGIINALIESYIKNQDPHVLNKIRNFCAVDFPSWHFLMMQDEGRLTFYKKCIEKEVKGKVVLDLGAGGGYLTSLALQYGAKKVYAIERHPTLCTILRATFSSYEQQGRFVLIPKDSREMTNDDFQDGPEVIIHEVFATDGLGEGVIQAMLDLKKFDFWNKATLIPQNFNIQADLISWPGGLQASQFCKVGDIDYTFFSNLGSLIPKVLFQDKSHSESWELASDTVCVLDHNFKSTFDHSDVSVILEPIKKATHLRIWFSFSDSTAKEIFSSDLKCGANHWGNTCYPLLPTFTERKIKANFLPTSRGLRLRSLCEI